MAVVAVVVVAIACCIRLYSVFFAYFISIKEIVNGNRVKQEPRYAARQCSLSNI